MKKILNVILTLALIIVLCSCGFESKKKLVERSERNISEDFDLAGGTSAVTQAYILDRCTENELSTTRSGRWGTLMLSSSKTYLLDEITYTIYNKSETESFYVYDVSKAEGTFSDDKKGYSWPTDPSGFKTIEIKPGEKYDVRAYFNGVKINKKGIFYFIYAFATHDIEGVVEDNIQKSVDNGGVCNLRMKYSMYM